MSTKAEIPFVCYFQDGKHMLFKATSSEMEKCGNDHGKWLPFNELHKREFIKKLKIHNFQKVSMVYQVTGQFSGFAWSVTWLISRSSRTLPRKRSFTLWANRNYDCLYFVTFFFFCCWMNPGMTQIYLSVQIRDFWTFSSTYFWLNCLILYLKEQKQNKKNTVEFSWYMQVKFINIRWK